MTADEIKKLRLSLNISQEDFARLLNVGVATVNRWENNHNKPSRLAIQQLNIIREKTQEKV